MKRKEIRREFKKLLDAELVFVQRDVQNNPVRIELCFPCFRADGSTLTMRSWQIRQLSGSRFINGQAWAVHESKRQVRLRFRSID